MLRRRFGALVVVVALLCAPIALGGCTAARNTLGPRVGTCFHALPVAAAAVHHRGKFAGVRLLSAGDLRDRHRLGELVQGTQRSSLCVVGFRGSFTSAQVTDPVGTTVRAQRPFAVVVVSSAGDHLLGVVLLRRPPFALGDLI